MIFNKIDFLFFNKNNSFYDKNKILKLYITSEVADKDKLNNLATRRQIVDKISGQLALKLQGIQIVPSNNTE